MLDTFFKMLEHIGVKIVDNDTFLIMSTDLIDRPLNFTIYLDGFIR